MSAIELAGFKHTYWSGHHLPRFAEPALGFPTTQSSQAAIRLSGGSTTGRLILCAVPKAAPARVTGEPNRFAGLIYAIVELWPVVRRTEEILEGYPAPQEVLDRWIDQWPNCLPIRRWYDLRTPRPFSQIHPDASAEARIVRGKLRTVPWLTQAAALHPEDLDEREVFVTPALEPILALRP